MTPVQPIVDVVYAIATVIVQIVVLVSLALAAIGFAQGAVSAQWANNIGSSIGLSQAWTRIIMTAVLAALAALVPIVIGIAAEAIRPYVSTNITLPRW
jgi:ABC-type Fe3+ transport system permease subunit